MSQRGVQQRSRELGRDEARSAHAHARVGRGAMQAHGDAAVMASKTLRGKARR
jgi:hypothetical protein